MSNPLCISFPERPDRAEVRAWLIDGGDPASMVEGRPIWALAMLAQQPEGVDELLAAGADPAARSSDGRGWLHWATDTSQPEWLVLAGIARMGPQWWRADHQGRTPFHLSNLTPLVGQALGARWWGEQRRWKELLVEGQDPEQTALEAGNKALARVWRGWARACG